jgi:uncharacterized membrane protein YfcA
VSYNELSVLIFLGSAFGGFLGALTGLGGGAVVTPLLTLVFHVDLRYAIGASLITVIATSSGSASAYVREGYTNLRVGMLLEVATTMGALIGAWIGGWAPVAAVSIIFGIVLLWSSYLGSQAKLEGISPDQSDALARRLKLPGSYPREGRMVDYGVVRTPQGFSIMVGAGALSGLLGIGSGAFKVLAMDQVMRLPFKPSTTTSNFMMGVTAAASAGVYLSRGYIDPALALPVMLGVFVGSRLGAQVLFQTRSRVLRRIFSGVILLMGLQMIWKGVQAWT